MSGKTGKEFWGEAIGGAVSGAIAGAGVDIIGIVGIKCMTTTILASSVASGIANGVGMYAESSISGNKHNLLEYADSVLFGLATGALFSAVNGPVDGLMDNLPAKAGKTTLERIGYALRRATKEEFKDSLVSYGTGIIENTFTFLLEKIPKKVLKNWGLR